MVVEAGVIDAVNVAAVQGPAYDAYIAPDVGAMVTRSISSAMLIGVIPSL